MRYAYRWVLSAFLLTGILLLIQPEALAIWMDGDVQDARETFPPSRFGEPPAPPVYGKRRQLSPMKTELVETESSSKGRGLASLDQPVHPQAKTHHRTGTQEVAVIASELGFFPKTIFLTRDIPVRLYVTGAGKKPLCMMMDTFNVRKQVRSQQVEEVSFVPTQPGQYRFYCPINGAEGSIFVRDLNSAGL